MIDPWNDEEQRAMWAERNAAADAYEAEERERKIGPAREMKALNANLRELIGLLREIGTGAGWLK